MVLANRGIRHGGLFFYQPFIERPKALKENDKIEVFKIVAAIFTYLC
jgi:hypothetical protein